MQGRHVFLVAVSSLVLLSACFAESGLKDEFRDATRAIDDLVDELEDEGPVREAAERARDTVDEAEAALEDFREDPSTETRQALEDAKRRLDDSAGALDRLVDQAPDAIREVLDGLTELRSTIDRELEEG
jgi:uncharacterized phage infection (PIP) family protein YhgE